MNSILTDTLNTINYLRGRIQYLEQQNANLRAANANLQSINANLLANNDHLRYLLVNKRPREESSNEEFPSKWARRESSYVSSSFIGNSECSDSSEDMETESEDMETESEDTEIED